MISCPPARLGHPVSPFRPAVLRPLPEADEEAWTIDRLVAAVTCADAKRAAGALLASATWHGALLDRRCRDAWLGRIPGHHLGALAWVDLPGADDEAPSRWFADPTTRLLLDRWIERPAGDCAGLPPAADCLRSFLATDDAGLVRFAEQAEWRWRSRLPGVLMEKALGRTQDRSLRAEAWTRLAHARPVLVSAPPKKPQEGAASGKEERPAAVPYMAIARLLSDWSRQKRTERDRQRSRRVQNNDLVREAEALSTPGDPVAALLHQYALALLSERLTADGRGRYAPSTVGKYLSALRRHVFDGLIAAALNPLLPTDLWHQYERAAECLSGNRRHQLLNAVEAFDRFAGRYHPHLVVPDTDRLAALRESGRTGGVVNIVSGADYERAEAALAPFRTFEERQARLCLVLGYRAGLRDREIRALATDDLLFADGNPLCDLLIRNKWYAATKTRTSCRILPLHLLLQPDELADLRAWVVERRGLLPSARSVRLFPTRDRPARAMPAGFLGRWVRPALGAATGDETIAYGSLRHSFVSHLIATLLMPDDGTSLPRPAGWRDTDVSLSRKQHLMAALVGAERLGQGVLHAVGLLAGHLSTDATLCDYTHTLDWTLGAHTGRPANQPGLTIAQAAALAGISEAAVRKLLQRLPAGGTGAVAERGVPTMARPRRGRGRGSASAPPSAYPDQLLPRAARRRPDRITPPAPVRRRPAAKKQERGRAEVVAWRDLLACVKEGAASHARPLVAQRFGVEREALGRWTAARRFLLDPRDRARRFEAWLATLGPDPGPMPFPKHMPARPVRDRPHRDALIERWTAEFPRVPTAREADLIDPLWERAMRAPPEVIARGTAIFAICYDARHNAVLARGWAEAREFQLLVEALGIGPDVTLEHRPGRGRRRQLIAAISARLPKGVSRDDRIAFRFAATVQKTGRRTKSPALHQALVLLAILHLEAGVTGAPTRRSGPVLRRDDAMDNLAS